MKTSLRKSGILFEEKIGKIRSLIEHVDSNPSKSSIIVKTILDTWLEMLIRFPEEISEFKFMDIAEFLSEEAEKLLEIYNEKDYSSKIKIYKDPQLIYIFYSVTIEKRTNQFLFPWILLRVSDNPDFINNFYEEFIKVKPTLGIFIDLLLKNDVIIQETLTTDRFNKIKNSLEIDYNSRESIVKKNPIFWDDYLTNKRILNIYTAVNFHALELQLCSMILNRECTIPASLQQFVDIEVVGKTLRFIQICCRNNDQDVMEKFNQLEKLHHIEESYYYINLNDVHLSNQGFPIWERDYQQSRKNQGKIFKRLDKSTEIQKRLPQGMIKYLQFVHRDGNSNQYDRASILGSSRRSLQRYFRFCFDKKILLAYPSINRIGLDSYFQLIYDKSKNFSEGLKEMQFHMSVISSKDMERVLIYLPRYKIPELKKYIQSSERSGKLRIIAAEELTRKDFRRNYSLDFTDILRSN